MFTYNEKENSITLAELAYLIYFAVMLGAKAVGLYEGQLAYNVCLLIGAAFFGVKMLLTKYSVAEYLAIILLLALGSVIYLSSGEKSLLIFLTMMLGMKGVSVYRVFKTGAIIWVSIFVGMYVLSVIGVIPETAYTIDRYGWPPILRHTLGYPHPNTLHITYFILTIFVLYSCKKLSRKYVTAIAVILMLGNGYVFMYSLSRNGFYITILYILIQLYFLWRKTFSGFEKAVIYAIFPFCAIIPLAIPFILTGDAYENVNRIFAGRLIMTRHFLTYEPLKLFGIESVPIPEPHFVIDSSYVYLIFRLGIVAYVLYFVAMIFQIRHLVKEEMRAELAVVLALTIGGVNETYLFNQSYKNLIFIFLGSLFYISIKSPLKKLPKVLAGEQVGLSLGQKVCISGEGRKEYSGSIPINILAFSALLLLLVGLLTSGVYVATFKGPRDIYLPDYEIRKGDADEVYLTTTEVRELKKQGDFVRGYVDSSTPLYRMQRKAVAKMEYIRYIFSYGLWGGSIVCIVFLLYWVAQSKVRYFLRNRKIGSDYKENVLIVHNYYRIPGGEDVVLQNEKELLESKGHKVFLYTRNNDEFKGAKLSQKISLAFTAVFNPKTYRDICRIIEKEKIDVIQVHNTVALISPAVYLAGINRGVPVVQTVHNFRLVCPNGLCYINGQVCERCLEHGLKSALIHNCYRGSRLQTLVNVLAIKLQRFLQTYRYIYYICLTEFNKEKLLTVRQIKEDHIYIKPNFTTIDMDIVPYADRKRQVVYAGRVEKIKGIDLVLQAWMKLGDKAPKLIICGSGELDEWCREYVENNELRNVELRGQVPNSEVKKLIGESMAMLHSTQLYEGFPMTIAEAYTLGTPVIAADIGNVGKLVEEGVTGTKFKCNSVVAMAKAVERFVENPVKIPTEYLTKYTAEKNYQMLKGIYEDIRKRNKQ